VRRPYDREGRDKGKKIMVYESRALPGSVAKVDVRLSDKGVFWAKHIESWLSAPNLPELKAQVDESVRRAGPTSWEFFIEVSEVDVRGGDEGDAGHHYRSGYGWEQASVVLHFRAIKLSNEIRGTELDGWGRTVDVSYRLHEIAKVAADGGIEGDGDPEKYREGETLIPFTPERWRSLETIAAALRETGAKLRAFLNAPAGAPEFLDGVAGQGPGKFILAVPMGGELAPSTKKRARPR